ncbi:unnamed protein product [Dimorphilus gyrociliatus]|uniref:Uncharacterized protein n=1 Tax=Dimorphilus gyrociliatus TaxID=2664684 RepID=A0A7I8VJG8_9ANNE|nr:unnamed protein product [Dimorphilus gyrociliatus]
MSSKLVLAFFSIFFVICQVEQAKYDKACKSWDKVVKDSEEKKNSYTMSCQVDKYCSGMDCEGDFGWEYLSLMKTHYNYSIVQLPCSGNSFIFDLKLSPSSSSKIYLKGGYINVVTNSSVYKPIKDTATKWRMFTTAQTYLRASVELKRTFAIVSMEIDLKLNGLFFSGNLFNEIIMPKSILPLFKCNKNVPIPTFSKDSKFIIDHGGIPDTATVSPYWLIPHDKCINGDLSPQSICKTKNATCKQDNKCYCENSEYDYVNRVCKTEIIDGRFPEAKKSSHKQLITGICIALGLGSLVFIIFAVVCYKYRQFGARYSSDEALIDDDPPIDA